VASGVAHENTGTRGVSVVLAGEGTSGTARLVVLVLAAFANLLAGFFGFEVVFVASATSVNKLLAFAGGLVEVEPGEESSAGSSLNGQLAQTYSGGLSGTTNLVADIFSFEVVFIATTSSVDKSFALSGLLVEVKSRESSSAWTSDSW